MSRFLSSPRRRRRLAWLALLAAVAAGVAALVVLFPSRTGVPRDTSGGGGPIRVAPSEQRPAAAQSPQAQAAALATARDFIRTAVLRRHVGESWQLTGPKLRQGLTRQEWATGDIPVVPYPERALGSVRWRVDESFANELLLEVALLPKPRADVRPALFYLDLKAVGAPPRRHWLVEGWTPRAPGAPVPAESRPLDLSPRVRGQGPLGAEWLLAPVALVLLALLVPLFVFTRAWRRNRAAVRAYEAERSLPDLPAYRPR